MRPPVPENSADDTRPADTDTAVGGAAVEGAAISNTVIPNAAILPGAPWVPLYSAEPAHPSRLPRDAPLLGPDGRPAIRWTDPRVATAYANRDDDAERRVVWPLLVDAVRPAEPSRVSGRPDGTVLELGCGLGALARNLADEHWLRVHAVDVSPTMHRLGAARFRDAWILRTLPDRAGRLPLRRAQCTGAVVQRVLLHLPHPCLIIGLLTEARRVLRPGAPLAIAETDTRDEVVDPAGEPYTERYPLRDGATLPTTAWRHSPATLVSCLTSAGFTVDEIRPLSLPEPLLLYLARAV